MCNLGFWDLAVLCVEVRSEVTGDWIKSCNVECHNLYSPYIFYNDELKENEMGRACSM